MTTYNGKHAGYVAGKDVVNKEPPVSKYVVEKLYEVHRERVLKTTSVINSHVHIPEFLKNQSWKKSAQVAKQRKIAEHNQEIYRRIYKAENAESMITRDTKLHVKRVDSKMRYINKLKLDGRIRHTIRIQKENEYFLKRIERAHPMYSNSATKEWYKHHENFKAGRRSEPTGGHIMTSVKKSLLPSSLPPLARNGSSTIGDNKSSIGMASISTYNTRMNSSYPSLADGSSGRAGDGSAYKSSDIPRDSRSLASVNSMISSVDSSFYGAKTPLRHSGSAPQNNNSNLAGAAGRGKGGAGGRKLGSMRKNGGSSASSLASGVAGGGSNSVLSGVTPLGGEERGVGFLSSGDDPHGDFHDAALDKKHRVRRIQDSFDTTDLDNSSSNSQNNYNSKQLRQHLQENGDIDGDLSTREQEEREAADASAQVANDEDLVLISSRPFSVPIENLAHKQQQQFEQKNCLVLVYTSKQYSEHLHLKVLSAGITHQLLSERSLSIDKVYDITTVGSRNALLAHTSEGEDLQALSSSLIEMFQAADEEGSGFLTFDQFQNLMEKVDLGISAQELRFVISEADENDNGLVDYDEFVPLAVDLIQSFRARNRAKTMNSQHDVMVDDQIMSSISQKELEELAVICLAKINEVDVKQYGILRVQDIKRCLTAVSAAGLRENEVNMLTQMLPRDQFGRCKYDSPPGNFLKELRKVRFLTMKNAIIEAQGSGLQKYLLKLCKEAEYKQLDGGLVLLEKFMPTGIIACRPLINILSTSSRLSLSRLQVAVIMSEASVQEGMINYFQFIPVVAQAIELMFEPKSLRQRAELIEKTDLSPEALLKGMTSEMFEQRLNTLFKSYDIDHSGGLDQNEFLACLESLELQLSYGEMVALMAAADVHHRGFLAFEEFVSFFTRNLLHLEREKHIRLLQSSMQQQSSHHRHVDKDAGTVSSAGAAGSGSGAGSLSGKTEATDDFVEQLIAIFKLSDPDNTGCISYEDFESVLMNFSVHMSKFMLDVMLSELHVKADGMVDYVQSVPICADLLRVFSAKQTAKEEEKKREEWAEQKAIKVANSCADDINHIVKFLRQRIRYVNESISDVSGRVKAIQNIIRNPHNGLSRVEANYLATKLLNNGSGAGGAGYKSSPKGQNGGNYENRRTSNLRASYTGGSLGLLQAPPSPNTLHSALHHQQQPPFSMAGGAGGGANSLSPNGNSANGGADALGNVSPEKFEGRASLHVQHTKTSQQKTKDNHGRASDGQQHTHHTKQRTNFSTHELSEAVFEARKMSIMRSLLEDVDSNSIQVLITSKLEEELARVKENHANAVAASPSYASSVTGAAAAGGAAGGGGGRVNIDMLKPNYLPVNSCFKVLEGTSQLRLNRAQVMFIISWAECYDKDGQSLEIYKLAEQAASIIKQMNIPEVLDTRAEVLFQGTIDGKRALNGMREKELEKYLELTFSAIPPDTAASITGTGTRPGSAETGCSETGFGVGVGVESRRGSFLAPAEASVDGDSAGTNLLITESQFKEVLLNTPKVRLTEREVGTIVAGFPVADPETGRYNWRELLPTLVSTVHTMCRERMIHRRVSLAATSQYLTHGSAPANNESAIELQNASLKVLKDLAEKLLNYVKLVHIGVGPANTTTTATAAGGGGGGLSVVSGMSGASEIGSIVIQFPTDDVAVNSQHIELDDTMHGAEVSLLYKGARFFPLIQIVRPPSQGLPPLGSGGGGGLRRSGDSSSNLFRNNTASRPGSSSAQRSDAPSGPSPAGSRSATPSASCSSSSSVGVAHSASSSTPIAAAVATIGVATSSISSSAQQPQPQPALARRFSLMRGNSKALPATIPPEKITGKYPAFVKIYAVEDLVSATAPGATSSGIVLRAHVCSIDGSFSTVVPLSVKLPSIGSVDKEVAMQFAANIADKLYFEQQGFGGIGDVIGSAMTLKIYEDEEE